MHLNNETFAQLVSNVANNGGKWDFLGEKPALIDFYATWCGPCRSLAPILEGVAEEYAGRVDVYKVDVDQAEELAALFNIRSVPTLLFAPKEGAPTMMSGVMNRGQLVETIEKLLIK